MTEHDYYMVFRGIADDEINRQKSLLHEWDRILRQSVPERWKGCTSPIGSVQSYIAELETLLGMIKDRDDCPSAIMQLIEDLHP